MGVAIITRSSSTSFNHYQGHTEELVSWISNVRCKRNIFKRKRHRNIRIEAILNCALTRSESELKSKQQQRYKKWQLVKSELLKFECDTPKSQELNIDMWDSKTREDINSIHSFMSMLKKVKTPLER